MNHDNMNNVIHKRMWESPSVVVPQLFAAGLRVQDHPIKGILQTKNTRKVSPSGANLNSTVHPMILSHFSLAEQKHSPFLLENVPYHWLLLVTLSFSH